MKVVWMILLSAIVGCRQDEPTPYEKSIVDHRMQLHHEFRNPRTSPLPPEDISEFRGLDFFPVDSTYRVTAHLERLAGTDTFEMPATGNRSAHYVTHAIAHFELHGQPLALHVYRQVSTGEEYFFIPFKDLTCADESYGGGRYLDIHVPEGDSLVIDFNLAYNPYCAYNPRYSCPIPAAVNHLPVRIEAGEQDYGKH